MVHSDAGAVALRNKRRSDMRGFYAVTQGTGGRIKPGDAGPHAGALVTVRCRVLELLGRKACGEGGG